MKNRFILIALLLSATAMLTSCLNDNEDDTTYYDDSAITSFSLGTLNKIVHTTSSTGEDSTYTTTFDCSDYVFYIDQSKQEIWNPDSLPYGIDASKTLCSVSTKNSGSVAVNILTSDGTKDSLVWYSSSDSIDMTSPRQFHVYNNAGTTVRIYTVRVNVHKEIADTFTWQANVVSKSLASLTRMRAISLNNKIYVFGNEGGTGVVYSTNETDGATWERLNLSYSSTPSSNICDNVAVKGDYVYLFDNGQLMRSADAKTWNQIATPAITQLIGATSARLYALNSSGKIVSSADEGATWTEDLLDSDSQYLPSDNISLCWTASKTNRETNNVVVIGTRDAATYAGDSTAMVWGKVEENDEKQNVTTWNFYDVNAEGQYNAPRLTNLQATSYDGGMVALGGTGFGTCTKGAFEALYISYDGGITWVPSDMLTIPDGFSSSNDCFTIVADSRNYLWLICGGTGQVWRGRINRLGWTEEQTIFTE